MHLGRSGSRDARFRPGDTRRHHFDNGNRRPDVGGRSPWTAADALVGLILSLSDGAGPGGLARTWASALLQPAQENHEDDRQSSDWKLGCRLRAIRP